MCFIIIRDYIILYGNYSMKEKEREDKRRGKGGGGLQELGRSKEEKQS